MNTPHVPDTPHVLDYTAILTTILAMFDYAPKFAAFLSCIWLSTRLYEYVISKIREHNKR